MKEKTHLHEIKEEISRLSRLYNDLPEGLPEREKILDKLELLGKQHEEEYQRAHGNYDEWKTTRRYI